MANRYANVVARPVPQGEPLVGRESQMVQNNAGGFVFGVSDEERLKRFLILGVESPTYYQDERDLTKQNTAHVQKMLQERPIDVINLCTALDDENRAPRRTPIEFALALAIKHDDLEIRRAAAAAALKFCRTGSHLFSFLDTVNTLHRKPNGKTPIDGHLIKKQLIQKWYQRLTPDALAHQMSKYRMRNGFTHCDVIRLGHAKASEGQENLFAFAVGKDNEGPYPSQFSAWLQAQTVQDKSTMVKLIVDHDLVREQVPEKWLKEPEIWDALLQKMPMMAMVRNLGKMGSVGLIKPMSQASRLVVGRLDDAERVKGSRMHPIAFLSASAVYKSGSGYRGSLAWLPCDLVGDALGRAFVNAFKTVVPSGKNVLIAIDCSASMSWPQHEVVGLPMLRAREAAACMALVTAQTEPVTYVMGFNRSLVPLNISRDTTIAGAIDVLNRAAGGGTDCSQPMLHAKDNGIDVDLFCIFTDNETWAGRIHPVSALNAYRQKTGRNAKVAVVGFTSTGFSIADPEDGGMMDFVGFDSSAPAVMSDFARG